MPVVSQNSAADKRCAFGVFDALERPSFERSSGDFGIHHSVVLEFNVPSYRTEKARDRVLYRFSAVEKHRDSGVLEEWAVDMLE